VSFVYFVGNCFHRTNYATDANKRGALEPAARW